MLFLRGLAIAIFFKTISETFSSPRCPPINDLKGCKCEKSESLHILECNDVDLPNLQHVWVDEIIITKTKSEKVEFGFIQNCPNIKLQENENLNDISALLTDSVKKITLIKNKKLNIKDILTKVKMVEVVHIENFETKTLDIDFDLPKLNNLLLPSNDIQTIKGGVFKKLPNLNILDLSHNGINTLEENSLSFYDNLTNKLEIFLNDNQINGKNLSYSKLGENKATGKLSIHLENNKIIHISKGFDAYIKKQIKIFFDGNDITCDPYKDIEDLLKFPNAKEYLLNIFCKDYNNINIFEIPHFNGQSPTPTTQPTPLTTVPDPEDKKNGTLTLKIIHGQFEFPDKSYVAVCINDETQYDDTVDTSSCVLCGRSENITTNHTKYDSPCDLGVKKHKNSALLIFGAATVKDAKLSPTNVKGMAMITIKEALAKQKNSDKFQLNFDARQFIEVNIKFQT